MFSLRQRELSWDRPLFLLILINFIFVLQTASGDEINPSSDSNDKANEAIKITGDFVRSEKGIEWLKEVMKDRKSPLTTIDLVSAILKTTSLDPEVLKAAQTFKDLISQGNKDGGADLLQRTFKTLNTNKEDVDDDKDLICLYRKAISDANMKKDHDWKKLLEIAPGYSIHSVSDEGSQYFICLKKINITITTTPAPIVTTTLETPSADADGRKGMPPENVTELPKKITTEKTENKKLPENQEDSYEDCYEDETPESTIETTTKKDAPPTIIVQAADLPVNNKDVIPDTEDFGFDTNININENVRKPPKTIKSKTRRPRHKKSSKKNRKSTRRQTPIKKARKPKRNKNEIEPYLDPTVRKGSGMMPLKKPTGRTHRNLPEEFLDSVGISGLPVRILNKKVSKKHPRFTAIPFVLTISKIPMNPVPAIPPFQDIYPQTLSRIPCQDDYRKLLFPIRLYNPLVPLCNTVNQLSSSQASSKNLPSLLPYAVMQPVNNIQSNLPKVLIPQEYPTQVLAPYVNNYEPPTEIKISVQQPLIEEGYMKSKKINCDSLSDSINKDKLGRRDGEADVNKFTSENLTTKEVAATLQPTYSSTGEDKNTTLRIKEAENDTEIAVRMTLDDLKKDIPTKTETEQSTTPVLSH